MKKSYSALFVKSAIAMALAAPMLASAESQLVTTNTSTTGAVARLDFEIIIPKVLLLQVGSNDANINVLTFDYSGTPGTVGNGTASAVQGVPVRVRGNNGEVRVTASGSGAGLVSTLDPADVIPWSQIQASSLDVANFNVPAVGGAAVVPSRTGKVTDQNTTWNFAYANTNVVAPGTYEGQITYTATMP